jgi:hypothetical protein
MQKWYNPKVAERHYKADKERRAKANEKGEIWTCGDGWTMVVKV